MTNKTDWRDCVTEPPMMNVPVLCGHNELPQLRTVGVRRASDGRYALARNQDVLLEPVPTHWTDLGDAPPMGAVRWLPALGETYWSAALPDYTGCHEWRNDRVDQANRRRYGCFRTEAERDAHDAKLQAWLTEQLGEL